MAGFKDFANGNVLTGDELDGYLMQQSVMRFASTSARDSALAAVLTDGLMTFTTDTGTLWIRKSGAWVEVWPKPSGYVHSVAYSGTSDVNGYVTVTHGAGFTPVAGWAVTTNPSSSFAQFWGMDTIGATTLRLRFANASGGSLVTAGVSGRLFVVKP